MKVLFLDIDGVCNSEKHFQGSDEMFGIDPYMAFLVGKIVIETDCEIVLSSTWRLSKEGIRHVEKRVHKILDVTPQSAHGFRGDEVKMWLAKHPEVTRYAILDDDLDFHGFQPLFKTTWKHGLTADIAEQVINYLNGGEYGN